MGKAVNYCYSLDKLLRVYADSKPDFFILNLQKYCKAHIYPIEKTESIKSQLLQQLYNLTKTYHLKIPENEKELIKQLKNFTKDKKYSTDLADALLLSMGELPDIKESHSVWVANRTKFDSYLTPKFRELPKTQWNRGY